MSQRAQRLIEAARKLPVPEGTYAVGLGLLISGITAYGFQILAFKGLSKSEYAALNGLWILVFVVAPGFFLPLEQEVGRAVADRRSRSLGGGPVVKKAARAGAVLAGSLMVLSVIGAVAFGFTDRLFHGQEVLLVCFVIALGTYAVQHITRGTLSGNGRFGPYGMILGAEGVFRILPVIVVYAAGIDNLLWYGLALAIPPLLASLVAVRGQHGLLAPGPDAEWSELSTNLTLLFLGSLAAQTLSYAAALGVIVLAQGKHERKEAADFIVGFFIARIPILLFQAIQAALLPKLAALSGAGKYDDFRSGLKKLVMIVVGVGVLGIVAGATIGPIVGQILFGDKFNLSNQDLTLLFVGSAAFILALTLAQALIALLGHGRALIAWTVGLVLCHHGHELREPRPLPASRARLPGRMPGRSVDDGDLPADPPPFGDTRELEPPRRGHRARTARDLAGVVTAMRALVTGGAGFVARHLTAHLETMGVDVVTVDRVGPRPVDITDTHAVTRAITDASPDVVYHLAARSHVGQSWSDRDLLFRVNVDGTRHVLDACSEFRVGRVLIVGSAEQYGAVEPRDLPLRETTPFRPLTPYGESKAAAEALAFAAFRDHGLPAVCVARVQPHRTGPIGQLPRAGSGRSHRRGGTRRHRRDHARQRRTGPRLQRCARRRTRLRTPRGRRRARRGVQRVLGSGGAHR